MRQLSKLTPKRKCVKITIKREKKEKSPRQNENLRILDGKHSRNGWIFTFTFHIYLKFVVQSENLRGICCWNSEEGERYTLKLYKFSASKTNYPVVPIWLIELNVVRPFVVALSSVHANIVSCVYFGEMRKYEWKNNFFNQVDGLHDYLTSKMSYQPTTLKYRASALSLTKF